MKLMKNVLLRLRKMLPVVLLLLTLVAVVTSLYYFGQYQKLTQGQRELESVKKDVSRLMLLPDELPTLATVTEKEKLQDQTFFKLAENGDKVLIFSAAKKAVLYRPSLKRIIDVTTIQTLNTEQKTPVAVQTNRKVMLYNGTKTAGATNTIETMVKNTYSDIVITGKTSASSDGYDTSIIVDLTGKNGEFVKQLATLVKGEVGSLPSNEKNPDADILVIVGQQSL